MESGYSVLDSILGENSEDELDVEMLDVEEGEMVEHGPHAGLEESTGRRDAKDVKQDGQTKNRRRKNKKKKKNKKRRGERGPPVTDINRFVLDVCKRLKERKSYLLYTAVGCLGVSAISDLVKEVDAIQACGGQKTADGRRFRNGGGILWNILKTRDPNAYKEIMKKGKEFEKQFNQQHTKKTSLQNNEALSPRIADASTHQSMDSVSSPALASQTQNQSEEQNRAPVFDRIRVPVAYDDLLAGEDSKDEST